MVVYDNMLLGAYELDTRYLNEASVKQNGMSVAQQEPALAHLKNRKPEKPSGPFFSCASLFVPSLDEHGTRYLFAHFDSFTVTILVVVGTDEDSHGCPMSFFRCTLWCRINDNIYGVCTGSDESICSCVKTDDETHGCLFYTPYCTTWCRGQGHWFGRCRDAECVCVPRPRRKIIS